MTFQTIPEAVRSGTATVTPAPDLISNAVRALAHAVDIAQVHISTSDDGDCTRVSTIGQQPVVARSIADRLTAGMSDVEVHEWSAAGSRFVDVSSRLLSMWVVVTRYVGPVAATEPLVETLAVVKRVAALAGEAR